MFITRINILIQKSRIDLIVLSAFEFRDSIHAIGYRFRHFLLQLKCFCIGLRLGRVYRLKLVVWNALSRRSLFISIFYVLLAGEHFILWGFSLWACYSFEKLWLLFLFSFSNLFFLFSFYGKLRGLGRIHDHFWIWNYNFRWTLESCPWGPMKSASGRAWKCEFFSIICFKNVNEILYINLSWSLHCFVFLIFYFFKSCEFVTGTE